MAILSGSGELLIDIVGPHQVFTRAGAERALRAPGAPDCYRVRVLSDDPDGIVRSRTGLGLICTDSIDSFDGEIDTLIVAGSAVSSGKPLDGKLVDWIRLTAPSVRRLASVCTGSFLLAEAGLLERRRATTHWRYASELARRYPETTVEPDAIYVRDGNVYTSAGVTAGMDLALALVEEDFGRDLALSVARSMVLYLKRPGGQSQFSAALRRQSSGVSPVGRAELWIHEHLDEELSVERLSAIAGMSPRNFARVFTREAGTTPAKYVQELRMEEARRRLEEHDETIEGVAAACGFGSADSLQRRFLADLGTTPSEYRHRFTTALRP